MSQDKEFIDKLETKKADIVIAHWAIFAPHASGLYETCKELIQEENKMDGVIAGLVEPDNAKGGNVDTSSSPNLMSQSHDWAFRDANLHMIHSSISGISQRLEPNIFFIHGSPEACLWSELEPFDKGFSMTSSFQYMERSEYVIVFQKRHQYIWEHFSPGKVRFVEKGIDLERWTPNGMKMRFNGKPNILYGDVWRSLKDPFVIFFAMNEYFKKNPLMRFHPWALGDKRRIWEMIINKPGFYKFLGEYGLSGSQGYPEHWYRGGDMLISPTLLGEPSRVLQEALACGCPTITWDCNEYGDTIAFKKARPFDPIDMAEKCADLWEEIQADPKGVRRRARKLAEDNYDMKKMAKQVVGLAKEVVNKNSIG